MSKPTETPEQLAARVADNVVAKHFASEAAKPAEAAPSKPAGTDPTSTLPDQLIQGTIRELKRFADEGPGERSQFIFELCATASQSGFSTKEILRGILFAGVRECMLNQSAAAKGK